MNMNAISHPALTINLSGFDLMFGGKETNDLDFDALDSVLGTSISQTTNSINSNFRRYLLNQEAIDDATEAVYGNLTPKEVTLNPSAPLYTALQFYIHHNFNLANIGILYHCAVKFITHSYLSNSTLSMKRIEANALISNMNWSSQIDLLAELQRSYENPSPTSNSRMKDIVSELLALLSINLIDLYGSKKDQRIANDSFEKLEQNASSSTSAELKSHINLLAIKANKLLQPYVELIQRLPSNEEIQKIYSFEARNSASFDPDQSIRFNKELLLDAAVYTRPVDSHLFDSTREEQSKAVELIKKAKQEKLKVVANTNDGVKKEFFISQGGDLCVKTSARRGTILYVGDYVFTKVVIYTPTTARQNRLSCISSDIYNTRKYINKSVQGNSNPNNHYAASARNANPWLSPYKNGLSTGSGNDGDVFTLKRLLSKANSCTKQDIENSIKDSLATRCKVSLSAHQECLYNSQREEFEDGTFKWQAFITLRSSSNCGGKEYSFGLINDREFIGYDID